MQVGSSNRICYLLQIKHVPIPVLAASVVFVQADHLGVQPLTEEERDDCATGKAKVNASDPLLAQLGQELKDICEHWNQISGLDRFGGGPDESIATGTDQRW